MTMRLGVTGGIGSGKTTACRLFGTLGIPVFVADTAARRLMESSPQVMEAINRIAGRDLYQGGRLDRKGLADIIFGSPELLQQVNAVVHPALFVTFEEWADNTGEPYVILEAAILFESGADTLVDRVATISVPEEERIARVMKRDGLSRDEVLRRMENQLDDREREARSHWVISNSDSDLMIPALLMIHEEMMALTAKGG